MGPLGTAGNHITLRYSISTALPWGPILLPLETPPLVFIVCAATPCLRLECLDDFTSAGELRDGQIVKMIISGRNWHRLAFFLKGQDYHFL